jgi:hypothetical protein
MLPVRGCTFTTFPSAPNTFTRTGGLWRTLATADVGLLGLLMLYIPAANALTNARSHLYSSIVSAVQFPFRKLPLFAPPGAPGLSPPCKRHHQVLGERLWQRFNGGAQGTRWYYGTLADLLSRRTGSCGLLRLSQFE